MGPVFVHAYGMAYVLGVLAAVLITRRRWSRAGGDPSLVGEVALWGFPAGVIGGRLYFLITTPSQIPDHWWGPFAVWQGGLGIWGGIAAGVAGGLYILRKRLPRPEVLRFMDAAAPGLLVAQAIGRVGNYFNQELFGGPTTVPWGLEISPTHRPPGYGHYATFQPTFLYELVWDLSLAGFLIWLGHHRRIRPPGLLALYVAGYSGFRIFEETLRVDYSEHIFGLRLNFFVASVLCVAGLAWFIRSQRVSELTIPPCDVAAGDPVSCRRMVTPCDPTLAPIRGHRSPIPGRVSHPDWKPSSVGTKIRELAGAIRTPSSAERRMSQRRPATGGR